MSSLLVLQEGPIVAWQKHCSTGAVTRLELRYEIRRQSSLVGDLIIFSSVVFQLYGGPTGYEGFVIDDGRRPLRHGPVWPSKYWAACFGTKNRWHTLRIDREEMTRVLSQYFDNHPLIGEAS